MDSNRSQSVLLAFLFFFLLILSFFIVEPYLTAIILSAVFAIAFWPIYLKVLSAVKSRAASSLLMVFLVLIVFLLPLFFVGSQVLNETYNLYNSFFASSGNVQISHLVSWLNQKINESMPAFMGPFDLASYARSILDWFLGNVAQIFAGVAKGFLTFVLSLFILFYLFRDGKKIKKFLIEHSPLNEPYNSLFIEKMKEATNSVVRGSLTVAFLQGIVSGIGFYIFGVPNPSLWGSLTFVAAFVPTLGTALIIVPVVIYNFFNSNLIMALGLLVWEILSILLIDNTLGPVLVGKGMRVHPLVVFIGVLGGVSVFGPMGFVVGPIIFALLYAVSDVYFDLARKNSEVPKT